MLLASRQLRDARRRGCRLKDGPGEPESLGPLFFDAGALRIFGLHRLVLSHLIISEKIENKKNKMEQKQLAADQPTLGRVYLSIHGAHFLLHEPIFPLLPESNVLIYL